MSHIATHNNILKYLWEDTDFLAELPEWIIAKILEELYSEDGGGGDAAPAPVIAECSDGIDNDGDGGIDNSGIPHDPECHFTDPFTGITYQCPGWLSESIAPTTHIDCVS